MRVPEVQIRNSGYSRGGNRTSCALLQMTGETRGITRKHNLWEHKVQTRSSGFSTNWGSPAGSSSFCSPSAGRSGTRRLNYLEREKTTAHKAKLVVGTRIAVRALSRIHYSDLVTSELQNTVPVVIVLIISILPPKVSNSEQTPKSSCIK
jgi:hypothetical protein